VAVWDRIKRGFNKDDDDEKFVGLINDEVMEDPEWIEAVGKLLGEPLFSEFKDAFNIRSTGTDSESPSPVFDFDSNHHLDVDVDVHEVENNTDNASPRTRTRHVTFEDPPKEDEDDVEHTRIPPTPAPLPLLYTGCSALTADSETGSGDVGYLGAPSPIQSSPEEIYSPVEVVEVVHPEVEEAVEQEQPHQSPQTQLALPGHHIVYDMHVALLDRPTEMRNIVRPPPLSLSSSDSTDQPPLSHFFERLKNAVFHGDGGEERWTEFERLLYTGRDVLDDVAWVKQVGKWLEGAEGLFAVWKEVVGY
ncbi:hypothetical protein HK102_012857, partial [Quaeritorhiza haematococci]